MISISLLTHFNTFSEVKIEIIFGGHYGLFSEAILTVNSASLPRRYLGFSAVVKAQGVFPCVFVFLKLSCHPCAATTVENPKKTLGTRQCF